MRFSIEVLPAPAVHLRPPRDAGPHLVPQHVLRVALLELLDEVRPLGPRADQRHVALEHVPDLRQLVEVEAAQQPPDRRAPRVVLGRPDRSRVPLGVLEHRPVLVDGEGAPVEAHPLLAVEHRPGRGHPHQQGDHRERDPQHQQGKRRAGDVDRPLERAVQPLQRHVVDVDDREAVQVLEPRPQRDELEEVGHHLHVHALAGGPLDHLHGLPVLLERQRHVDVVHPLALDDLRRPRRSSRAAAGPDAPGGPRRLGRR